MIRVREGLPDAINGFPRGDRQVFVLPAEPESERSDGFVGPCCEEFLARAHVN